MVDLTQHVPFKPASSKLEVKAPRRSAVKLFRWCSPDVNTAALAIGLQAVLQVGFSLVLNLVFRWLLTAVQGEHVPGALFLAGYVGTAYSLLVTYISISHFRFLRLLGACSLVWPFLFLGGENWLWGLLGTGVAVFSVILLIPLPQEKNRAPIPAGKRQELASGLRSSPDGIRPRP